MKKATYEIEISTDNDEAEVKKVTYEIEISTDNDEAEAFCEWLNANGHLAFVGFETGNYVDGTWTSTDDEANEIMVDLWNQYCKS